MTDMQTAALNPEQLLSALQRHHVEFVIIGGFSLAAHGVVRATKDIDIAPEPSQANLERLAAALAALEAKIELGDIDSDELGIGLDGYGLSHGGNFCLMTSRGRLDVMQDIAGVRGYDELSRGAVEVAMPGVPSPLQFASYEALLAMKSAAGRDQDLIDIADLRQARGES
jgi:Nucleotidyl transferase AbiEii toxin, Type IV TA system